ncbi:hypothetical protein ACGC1H_000165 [Rhizoctonia solani]
MIIVACCHRKRRSPRLNHLPPPRSNDSSMTTSITNNSHADIPIVPPQLPPVLASVFDLKPILGNPSRGEVKLVHEAANLRPKAPDLRDTDLLIELSQHLFDIQMACHQQKYPTSVLPNDAVYDPPTLPVYIPVELKPVSGPPSNDEIASVHTALRISESFANVPSTFDPDVHVQLSQHLFDIQLARHVQRSIMKRSAPAISMHMDQDVHEGPSETDGNNNPKAHTSPAAVPHQVVQSTESQNAPLEQPSSSHEATSHENPRKTHEHYGPTEFIVQIRDKLEDITRILVGTQNSLARVIGLLQGLNTVTDRRNRASTPAQSRAAMVTLVLATTSVHIA